MPDLSAFVAAASTFISQYPLFVGSAVVILLVLGLTARQSANAHRRSTGVQIPTGFGTDPDMAEQRARFWQHAMHQDTQFNDRLNFFLVFESILLGIVAALYARSSNVDFMLWAIALLGLVITLLWMNVQVYQKYYLDSFSRRLEQLPEFAVTAEYNRKWRPGTARRILTYIIPLTVALIWLGIIGVFLKIHF
jgi:hypothetical protein